MLSLYLSFIIVILFYFYLTTAHGPQKSICPDPDTGVTVVEVAFVLVDPVPPPPLILLVLECAAILAVEDLLVDEGNYSKKIKICMKIEWEIKSRNENEK